MWPPRAATSGSAAVTVWWHAVQVHVEHAVERLPWHRAHGRASRGDPGVRDGDVEAAEPLDRLRHRGAHRRQVRDVAADSDRALANALRGLPRGVGAQVEDGDRGATVVKRPRGRVADAPGATRDQRDLAVQAQPPHEGAWPLASSRRTFSRNSGEADHLVKDQDDQQARDYRARGQRGDLRRHTGSSPASRPRREACAGSGCARSASGTRRGRSGRARSRPASPSRPRSSAPRPRRRSSSSGPARRG